MGALDAQFGQILAQAVLKLLNKNSVKPSQVRAIGNHGQTIRHRPDGPNGFSLQIGDPNRLAEATGIEVVADFRRRDMAVGGQGAPLAPLFHRHFMGSPSENRAVLNLGGIANITYLPKSGSPLAFDTGPANGLMDAWIEKQTSQPYDRDGQWASSGTPQQHLVEKWLEDAYFLRPPPKSTGKEYFTLDWLKQTPLEASAVDIQASLLQLTTKSIEKSVQNFCGPIDRLFVCGGGIHNSALMQSLSDQFKCPVESTQVLGLQPDWIEAMTFAWLAKNRVECIPMHLTPFTGAQKDVILGAIYPV